MGSRSAYSTTAGTLYFDGDCGMCTRAVNVLRRINRTGRLTLTPLQEPGLAHRLGITHQQLMASIWWIGDDGAIASAARAANLAVATATGVRVPLWLYMIPGVGWTQEKVYAWVATHRQYFPGVTPYCEHAPQECGRSVTSPTPA
ncbi:thiol-disulfide oxidoreductase DCC family protein [Williamsia sp. CHRR-6]|uniref:thiol-disulfide oxidoreductase DCC family protein n=1 Tax=Williamsia sp. CHRR-6 TaxID=2835871 RepID=UPI001BD94951|nr:DCC1-like thiol-disulfide oxidoreductase family protein [Williamsia sp. CHRR-6]MBT0567799.1 DUF393 domain-containing protein [Williamsia sp. CHRR-6]